MDLFRCTAAKADCNNNLIMKKLFTITFVFISILTYGQELFPDKCIGTWKGTMLIYGRGVLRDSVKVTFTVAKSDKPNEWIWRTEYHSEKMPMTKDYLLRLKDAEKKIFVTDEKDGIELQDHLFGSKLYSMFETQGIYLTSSYELRKDEIIFEVTSGKKIESGSGTVINYSVDNLQRVTLRKIK
jgi:hypothetical protein